MWQIAVDGGTMNSGKCSFGAGGLSLLSSKKLALEL